LGKRLAAEPVGPEQHGLPLVVEVLAEEVEFGHPDWIGAHARILSLEPWTDSAIDLGLRF